MAKSTPVIGKQFFPFPLGRSLMELVSSVMVARHGFGCAEPDDDCVVDVFLLVNLELSE